MAARETPGAPTPPAGGSGQHPRRRRASMATAVVLLLAVAAGLVVWLALGRSSDGGASTAEAVPTTTAKVERRDLVETESYSGTLGFDDRRTIESVRTGTVTFLPDPGTIVRRGEELMRIDDRPTVLFYGDVPSYRPLTVGVPNGRDVRELERNLVELGYDPDDQITVDEEFAAATSDAVKRWQEDLGVSQTGAVDLGDIVVLPSARRVGQQLVAVGSPVVPGAPVMEVASRDQVVTLDLPADRQNIVAEGDPVQVELPSGRNVTGTITDVGSVAESQTLPDGTRTDPTIPITIDLAGRGSGNLDQAPVTVDISKSQSTNVLAVPITALVALKGGGYAVEVQSGGDTTLVPVEAGVYADGYVEVTGDLEEGMVVVVPA